MEMRGDNWKFHVLFGAGPAWPSSAITLPGAIAPPINALPPVTNAVWQDDPCGKILKPMKEPLYAAPEVDPGRLEPVVNPGTIWCRITHGSDQLPIHDEAPGARTA